MCSSGHCGHQGRNGTAAKHRHRSGEFFTILQGIGHIISPGYHMRRPMLSAVSLRHEETQYFPHRPRRYLALGMSIRYSGTAHHVLPRTDHACCMKRCHLDVIRPASAAAASLSSVSCMASIHNQTARWCSRCTGSQASQLPNRRDRSGATHILRH